MKSPFLDRLIGRLERVDPQSLQSFVLKLAREKGFLETLFNTIQEGIVVIDPEGRISYLNAAAAKLLGVDAAEGLNQPIGRYLRDLDWKKLWSADRSEWHKVAAHELEVFYPRRRHLGFYIVPLLDEANESATALAIIFRDLTESRRQTESAIESERTAALTLLAAGVAHEIGNPLNSLNIHLQLMERELRNSKGPSAERLRNDVRVARDEIARLDSIINQFLRAIRPTKPDVELASVNDILRETVKLLEREIRDRDILVELELADDLPRTLVDRGQIKQAVYNVIKNGLQAMSAGGILRARTEADSENVIISIIDTGHGIPPDKIGLVFEPYYTTKKSGSGLGLMIVQRILRDHGGAIELESDVDRGTTVRLKLPIHEKRTRLLPAPREPAPGDADSADGGNIASGDTSSHG
jgi:two-component system, sporulation sensor kinase E